MLVIDFVYSFSHPPVCKNPANYSIPDGHRFFSHELPDDDVGILTRLTVPPRTILVKKGKQERAGMARRKLLNFLTWGAKKSVSAPSVEEVEEVGGSFELGAWI